jgi:hydroxyacylglutathione hydrolase
MEVHPVALNSDNYGYILVNSVTDECAFVDVSGQPEVMMREWHNFPGKRLTTIFTTHKHSDHAGGNKVVAQAFPGITIYGGTIDNVEACTNFVNDGDELRFGPNFRVSCIHTPGHTRGHISYYFTDGTSNVVFTGDTLFVGGAGKFFEGTGADMYPSLYEKLAKLPLDTLVYCGHEYTLSNYRFALSIEPENERLQEENRIAVALRAEGKFTIPSTIEKELATNPFLRIHEASIRSRFPGVEDPFELLTCVREAKNRF